MNNKVYPVAVGDFTENILDMRKTHDAGTILFDGFTGCPGGMNAGKDPSLLESAAQYAFGVNLTSRGGLLKTRPPFIRLEAYIPPGKFQGAARYRRTDGDRIVYCVDGVVYSLNLGNFRRYKIATFPSTGFDRAYFCQADRYMVVQNGITNPENWPVLLDGDFVLNNADVQYFDDTNGWQYLGDHAHYEAVRVPIGTSMAYGHNRLFVAVPRIWDTGKLSGAEQWLPSTGTRAFCASDIFQSDNPSEFLAFIESTYLSGGGAIPLPGTLGYITGMTLFRASASGTGLGALVVFGSEGVCAYGINSPRAQWQDIDLANVLFLGSGTESPYSITTINDDIAFRSTDGWRFLKYTATQVTGSGGNLSNMPQSFEMSPVIDLDSRIERSFASAAYVNNRLLMTSAGYISGTEVLFDALISLDTANVGAVSSVNTTPAYDGIWTGHAFMQVLDARYDNYDRAFMFVKVDGTRNELWYLDDTSETTHLDGNVTPIASKLMTRTHTFQAPRNTKEFKHVEEWLSKTRGVVTLGAYWRSDGYELWNACVPYTFNSDVTTVADSLAQGRWRLRLPPARVDSYDPVTGRDVRMGTAFQFCFTWTGTMKLDKLLLQGIACTEATADTGCTVAEGVPLIEGAGGVSLDMYDYTIPPLTLLAADTYWDAVTIGREPLFYWVFTSVVDGIVYGELTIVGPTSGGVVGGGDSDWNFVYPPFPEGPDPIPQPGGPGGGSGGSGGGSGGVPYTPTVPIPPLGPGDQTKVDTKGPNKDQQQIIIIWRPGPDGPETSVTPGGKDSAGDYIPPSPANKYLALIMPGCITVKPGETSGWSTITVKNYGSKLSGASFGLTGRGTTNSKVTVTLEAMTGGTNVNVPAGDGNGYRFTLGAGEEMSFRVKASVDSSWAAADGVTPIRFDYEASLKDVTWEDGNLGRVDSAQSVCVIVEPLIPVMTISTPPTFQQIVGYDATTSTFTIENTGAAGSILDFTLTPLEDDAGITLSPLTGSLGQDEQATITATLAAGKVAGEYVSSFTASAPGVQDQNIDINLSVVPVYTGSIHIKADITYAQSPYTPGTDCHIDSDYGYDTIPGYAPYYSVQYYPERFVRFQRQLSTGQWQVYWTGGTPVSTYVVTPTYRQSDGCPSVSVAVLDTGTSPPAGWGVGSGVVTMSPPA